MTIDLEELETREGAEHPAFRAPVVVVGAGIAGLVLAERLAYRGVDVAVLEAGGLTLEERSQRVYQAHMAAHLHTGTTQGRFRTMGGSSTRWGGQMLPYTPDIFAPPAGVPSPAWPISGYELAQYFPESHRILGADNLPFEGDAFLGALGRPVPELVQDAPELHLRFSKWARFSRRNLAATLAAELDAGSGAASAQRKGRVTFYIHANVTELLLTPDGARLAAVLVRNYAGARFRFEADEVVLAAGTIETSRLLLASRSVAPAGVGNDHDQVGRYFHDHISVPAAELSGPARVKMVAWFAPFLLDGTTHSAKLEASPELRTRLHLLAVMAHLTIEEPEDSGAGVARALLTALQHRDLKNAVLRQLPKLPAASLDIARLAFAARVRKRRHITDRATVTLRIDTEQMPRAEQRIRLHESERDHIGLPKTVVDWRVADAEIAGVRRFAEWLRKHFAARGLGDVAWRPELFNDRADISGITDTYHPMGGARMGTDPRASVVTPELRVHGVANLSVASAAVYPAGGSSNPTFTLMALAMQLADRLATRVA